MHSPALTQLCACQDAQKKTRGLTPVSAPVVQMILTDTTHFDRTEQLIKICKPLIDASLLDLC